MPDPNRLLTTIRRAAQAFRQTPGRRGRLVRPERATEVLVAGDLHGQVENFRKVLERAQLAKHPGRHLVLQELIHGPFRHPAGGDKSHQLVDLVAALKCQFPERVHYLLGNHELAQWSGQWIGKADEDFTDLFRAGVRAAYGDWADRIYEAYLDLFAAIPLAVQTANRVFISHSLPSAQRMKNFEAAVLEHDLETPGQVAAGGPVHALLWGRDTAPETVATFLVKVDADLLVTGHIPCDKGFEAPNDRQLILDAAGANGCYCLFPADRPVTHADLLRGVGKLWGE
jgi:hypothetical protein